MKSIVAVLCLVSVTINIRADEREPDLFSPDPVPGDLFTTLTTRSPFTRTLNLSDTLVLSGIAQVEDQSVLTILDTEDGSSITVSDQPNDRGWRMVKIDKSEDLESATASISFSGGEMVRVRYDKDRLKSTAQRMKYKKQARAQISSAKTRQANGQSHGVPLERVNMLKKIDQTELPKGYNPGAGKNAEESHRLHQNYVDGRMSSMSAKQRGAVGMLWKQQVTVNPQLPNRGASFVRILEHVANHHPK